MLVTPNLGILDQAAMDYLHQASIQILETIGVKIPHLEMRHLFQEAGAVVNEQSEVVKIPERLVSACLKSTVKEFTFYGRDRTKQAKFGQGCRNYISSAGQATWLDDTCTQRRYASMEDVPEAARLADGLPLITLVGAMADPHELPVSYRCVAVAAELLKHTTKPVQLWFYNRASSQYLLEILTTICGSEDEACRFPLTFPFLEPISPLKFPFDGIDLLFETARFSLPVPVGPMAQAGASAPCTLAGTLAQENAEILAGICITQLIKPGTPVFYSGIPHAFDMRTSQIIFAGPEQSLMAIAMAQMGKYYHLPVGVNVGYTDSKTLDGQAGLEMGITLATGALAGADVFGAYGICGADQGASLAMLVMQHENSRFMERILRGIEISDAKLGLDVIRSVGHDGTFLDEEHTVRNFRKELWFPQILNREYWPTWVEGGAKTMHERCIEYKDKILREHQPEPLDEYTIKELDRIVESAKVHLMDE